MGIWQDIKDKMWLAECDVIITEYAPQHTTTAKEFCADNKSHLLELKAVGKSTNEAVIDTCILFINAIAEGRADTDPFVAKHALVAYQTGFGFLNKWPNINVSNDYAVRMFRVMALVDSNIWQSPLAQSMNTLLEEDSRQLG